MQNTARARSSWHACKRLLCCGGRTAIPSGPARRWFYVHNTRKMLNHPGASLSKKQIAFGNAQTDMHWLSVQSDYYGYTGMSNHELAGESVLCMSGHARHVSEASVHPAVCHSQPALSHDRQSCTIVQKVRFRACCQCIQLDSWIVFALALFHAGPAVWQ